MARTATGTPLDDAAWQLLAAVQEDGRAPLKSLAAATGLSVAATAERLKRLQSEGLVKSIAANLDATQLGYAVKAFIGINVAQPGKKGLIEKLRKAPEVVECHHVAGADSYMMFVVAQNLEALERFIGSINAYGETRTSIVFSTPIERRGLVPPGSLSRR